MKNIEKCKAVVFDMDGVIFDSERLVLECWMIVAEKYKLINIETAFRASLGTNTAETKAIMLERYGRDFPFDEFRKETSVLFHSKYDNGRLPMKKGVPQILAFLKEQGVKIALASSTRRAVVEQELSDAGILPYFEKVICGDMVTRSKPAPDIYEKACGELGVEPCKSYAIEDSYNGIRSAYQAGLHPIMVPDMSEPTEEMRDKAEVVLDDLPAVMEYLMKKAGLQG